MKTITLKRKSHFISKVGFFKLQLILFLVFIVGNQYYSQNLVPNPGFETVSSCPTASDQLIRATPWDRGFLTPDAFNTCGPTPMVSYGTCSAHTGTGMMGLFCQHVSTGNDKEYATIQLSSALPLNTLVTVSFWARVASVAKFKYTIDKLGCYFTSASTVGTNFNGGAVTPQVQTPNGTFFSTTWTQFTMTFTTPNSGSPLQYMTIGNFNSNASTSTSLLTSLAGSNSSSAYIFLDDFSVTAGVILPIELIEFRGEAVRDDNVLSWTTASEINNDYFSVEKSSNGIDFEGIGVQNGAGNSSINLNYSMIDGNVEKIINYYRLKQTDFDGKFNYSEIIAIDNRLKEGSNKLVSKVNILGQQINEDYRGIVIEIYQDGTTKKVFQHFLAK